MAQSPGREEGEVDRVLTVSGNSFMLADTVEQPLEEMSNFSNTSSLSEDLKALTSSADLCDVTFLIGEHKEPVYGVKAIICARSKVFHKLIQTQSAYQKKPHRKLSDVKPSNIKSGPLGNLRLFNRRASETGHVTGELPGSLLAAPYNSSSPPNLQIVVEEYDPEVFVKVMEYVHSGTVTFEPKTLIGLVNAAEHYGFDDLVVGCANYMRHCVSTNTVCDLLLSAEKYIQYKTTKVYVQKVMEFIDKNAESILSQKNMTILPCHVLSLILAREEARASALTKFNAALAWSRAHQARTRLTDRAKSQDLKEVFEPFLEVIPFGLIPACALMKEVKPLEVVPDNVIMAALAYQADPDSVAPQNPGSRRPSGRICPDDETIGSSNDLQEEINRLGLTVKANPV